MKSTMTQKEKVLKIVKSTGKSGIRTSYVVDRGSDAGIVDSARRLRELKENKKVRCVQVKNSDEKKWIAYR